MTEQQKKDSGYDKNNKVDKVKDKNLDKNTNRNRNENRDEDRNKNNIFYVEFLKI